MIMWIEKKLEEWERILTSTDQMVGTVVKDPNEELRVKLGV